MIDIIKIYIWFLLTVVSLKVMFLVMLASPWGLFFLWSTIITVALYIYCERFRFELV